MTVYNLVNQIIGKSLVGAIALSTTVGISATVQAQSMITNSNWWDGWACPAVMGVKCIPWIPPTPGSSQINPILPDVTDRNRFIFRNVPSGRWYDPPTTYGFHFLTTSNSLFTQILDFPTGIDSDNLFTVSVGNKILGQFSPSTSVDFIALLGQGVSEFTITGIDPLVDATNPTAFPIKLAFNTETANFEMLALEHPQSNSIPESGSEFALLIFGGFGLTFLVKGQGK